MLRWQVDPYRRAARPEERKPRGSMTFRFSGGAITLIVLPHTRSESGGRVPRALTEAGVVVSDVVTSTTLFSGRGAAADRPNPLQQTPKSAIVMALRDDHSGPSLSISGLVVLLHHVACRAGQGQLVIHGQSVAVASNGTGLTVRRTGYRSRAPSSAPTPSAAVTSPNRPAFAKRHKSTLAQSMRCRKANQSCGNTSRSSSLKVAYLTLSGEAGAATTDKEEACHTKLWEIRRPLFPTCLHHLRVK
ncbi:hypothetical protein FHR33_004201 [Nonomuraea dietziae]|uniref:Uncharacterized protein n=1 Tax=Nonomuraea dietziae TaxID=65515 RepID=A0A7W5V0W9_9ACTN|nr:hypothetical protein [Nonomuraea dietziae]